VGAAITDVGEKLEVEQKKRKDARDKQEVAGAKSILAQRQIEIEDSLADDPDYTTLRQRGNDLFNEARSEAAGMISDPRLQAAFDVDTDLDAAKFNSLMHDNVRAKKHDADTAWTVSRTEADNASYARGDEDTRAALRKTTPAMIQALADSGAITQAAAQKQIKGVLEDYDEIELNAMEPKDAITELNNLNGLASGWDADKREALIKSKKAEEKADKAYAKKVLLAGEEADIQIQLTNQNILRDELQEEDADYDVLKNKIRLQDLNGQISDSFATEALAYATSAKAINAVTDTDLMADLVTRMYDLNARADESDTDYLTGVDNLHQEILSLRASGVLDRKDEEALTKQMKTLTANKTAEATNRTAWTFGEANDIISEALPPEYRGKATRALFYRTAGQEYETDEEEQAAYQKHARTVVDNINTERRARTLKTLKQADKPEGLPKVVTEEDFDALESGQEFTAPDGTVRTKP
jgi:hypothetical protein